MVAHHIHIVADMRRRVRLRIPENRVYGVPGQHRAVLVVTCLVDVFRLVHHAWRGSQEPVTRIVHVDVRRRALEIIDVRCSDAPYIVRVARDEVCKLSVDGECGRSGRCYPRNLVDGICQPLHLRLPTTVNAPDSVRQRLGTRVHFGRQRPFAQVHDRTADHEVFVELILQMCAEERLALQ